MGQKKVKEIDLAEELEEQEEEKEEQQTQEAIEEQEEKKQKTEPSARYKKIAKKVDNQKKYSLNNAVDLLLDLATTNIDETVELHINTRPDSLTGSFKLPHGTGKERKIAIADEKLIEQVQKQGDADFDVLIAEPKLMPKVAKLGPILGPRGLMPSHKTNTITENPKELKEKLESGAVNFKTERKAPLLHLTIGKISFGKKKLLENLKAAIKGINKHNIKKAVITSTHAPGIKLDLQNIE
jgi:large subunit ribosomal protein L1